MCELSIHWGQRESIQFAKNDCANYPECVNNIKWESNYPAYTVQGCRDSRSQSHHNVTNVSVQKIVGLSDHLLEHLLCTQVVLQSGGSGTLMLSNYCLGYMETTSLLPINCDQPLEVQSRNKCAPVVLEIGNKVYQWSQKWLGTGLRWEAAKVATKNLKTNKNKKLYVGNVLSCFLDHVNVSLLSCSQGATTRYIWSAIEPYWNAGECG